MKSLYMLPDEMLVSVVGGARAKAITVFETPNDKGKPSVGGV